MSDIIAQVKPPFSELRENNRLQWMIFAGLLIVFFTVITWLSGTITDLRSDNVQSQDLAVRLQNISEQVFDEALLSETRSQVDQEISLLPIASSASVAEARALKELEVIASPLISKTRFKLLGSEKIQAGGHSIWEVRVDVSGKMSSANLIDLLSAFDSSQGHRRISLFWYKPHRNNTITMSVDILYLETKDG